MPKHRILLLAGALISAIWFQPLPAAAGDVTELELPSAVQASVDYLLAFGADTDLTQPDPERMAAFMAFVLEPKSPGRRYIGAVRENAHSAYNQFDIRTTLPRLLQYAYNPDVPSQFLMPTSVRMSRWQAVDTASGKLPKLWQQLPLSGAPIVLRGTEMIEITPDKTTGTYYRYREHKTLILLRHGNRNAMISISRQPQPSEMGEQGLVLGKDEEWNYFYSGLKGTQAPLGGSLETYIYGSWGVTVFTEIDGPEPAVRLAAIKWLKAGWKGLNMVRSKHIHAGMKRFANAFKPILESPNLPSVAVLSEMVNKLDNSADAELRDKIEGYVDRLTALYRERLFSIDRVEELIRTGDYVNRMDRHEMRAILALEYIKDALGKSPIIDRRLLADSRP
jgi:hypothetical protein